MITTDKLIDLEDAVFQRIDRANERKSRVQVTLLFEEALALVNNSIDDEITYEDVRALWIVTSDPFAKILKKFN